MKFHYTQIFLTSWIVLFWTHHFLTYGRVEEKFESSISKEYEIQSKWGMYFGIAFITFTLNILIYFFYYPSRNWFLSWSFLDSLQVNIVSMIIMCFGFLLYILFTVSVGKKIREACNSNERPALISGGIYGYIRNPGYLAFYMAAFGCLLMLHNLITLIIFIYICVVVYGHTLEEERKLVRIYGEEYKEYKKRTGRFFPKLIVK